MNGPLDHSLCIEYVPPMQIIYYNGMDRLERSLLAQVNAFEAGKDVQSCQAEMAWIRMRGHGSPDAIVAFRALKARGLTTHKILAS